MKFGILSFDIGNEHSIVSVVEHAVKVEEAGLTRFWLGEHYGATMWVNPEPLIPVILGMTDRIKVGAAGILMNLHSTYRVACSFKLMNGLFPGRVDLGIAKGASEPEFIELLHDFHSVVPKNTKQKMEELFSFFNKEDEYLKKGITVPPYHYPSPNLWLLGLSYRGLTDALTYNSNFSRSLFHHISVHDTMVNELNEFVDAYDSKYGKKPQVNIAISGIVASSAKEAKNMHSKSVWGKNSFIIPNILGDKHQFTDYVLKLHENYKVDEIIFLDLSPSLKNKFETIELLSEIQSSVASQDKVSLSA